MTWPGVLKLLKCLNGLLQASSRSERAVSLWLCAEFPCDKNGWSQGGREKA